VGTNASIVQPRPGNNASAAGQTSSGGDVITLEEHRSRVSGLDRRLTDALGKTTTLSQQLEQAEGLKAQLAAQVSDLEAQLTARNTALSDAQQAAQAATRKAHLLGLAASHHPRLLNLLAADAVKTPVGETDEDILAELKALEGQFQMAFSSPDAQAASNLPKSPAPVEGVPSGAPQIATSQQTDVDALRKRHRDLALDFSRSPDEVEKEMREIEAILHSHGAAGAL